MDTHALLLFLITARSRTYAGNTGEVKPTVSGYKQYEYVEDKFAYRDMYVVGGGRFVGIETIFLEAKPVWSMSYFGNFSAMSEKGADAILRKAMIANSETTRLWHTVDWKDGDYHYRCEGEGSRIDEIRGNEKIIHNNRVLYYFSYAGGFVG